MAETGGVNLLAEGNPNVLSFTGYADTKVQGGSVIDAETGRPFPPLRRRTSETPPSSARARTGPPGSSRDRSRDTPHLRSPT
jgi:hypothetical protein